MMKMVVALSLAAVMAMACARGTSGSGGARPTPAPAWTLATYTRAGGIAAFNDTLVVGEDGALTLTDKNGAVRKGSAPAEDLARLKSLLQSASFKALSA